MKKKNREPVPFVELVAYVEQLDALVIVCNEGESISIDSGDDATIAKSLLKLVKSDKLAKPIELIGRL